ncbi:MAG: hypothetical protein WA056_02225 [Gallionella sp.]
MNKKSNVVKNEVTVNGFESFNQFIVANKLTESASLKNKSVAVVSHPIPVSVKK